MKDSLFTAVQLRLDPRTAREPWKAQLHAVVSNVITVLAPSSSEGDATAVPAAPTTVELEYSVTSAVT
jgi:hypothetical protein